MSTWEWPRIRLENGRLAEDPEWLEMAKAYAAMPRDLFLETIEDWPQADYDEALRMRFRFDREWFLTYFWPDMFSLPFNDFQTWFLNRPKHYWEDRARANPANTLRVTAAPRGNAKTTLGKGEMVHDLVYGLEHYTIIISADLKAGSVPIMKDVISMATTNSLLAHIYGPIKEKRHEEKRGLKVGDNKEVGLFARSFKVQTRGQNFFTQRPTKFVVDDGEHPVRVLNPDNRKADNDYLTEDVLKAHPPEGGMMVDWVGTILHRDALLPNLAKNPAWDSKIWKAIPVWPRDDPRHVELWDQCRDIWADLTNASRKADARAFYKANRAEMDKGVVVLDPETWPLYRLYEIIWAEGLASFLKERQNDVAVSEYAYFDVTQFRRFEVLEDAHGRKFVPLQTPSRGEVRSYVDQMTLVGYLDPVPGKDLGSLEDGAGAGDYAAFAILGKDKFGYIYVLDVWMKRARDSEQIQAVWDKCKQWGCKQVAIESNNFARLITRDFRRSQKERKAAKLFHDVRFLDDQVRQKKEERIASLQPVAMENKWLLFNKALDAKVLEQFTDFPNGAHDDAPDAISGGYRKIGGSLPRNHIHAVGRVT